MATNGPISNNPLPGILPPHGPMPGPPTRPNTGQTPVTPVPPILPPLIPPIFPPTGPPIQRQQQGGAPVICCAGFNPELSLAEAIIRVTASPTPSQLLTDQGVLLRVGFWIQFAAETPTYLGEAQVHYYDIPTGPVYYAVACPLAPILVKKIFDSNSSVFPYYTLITLLRITDADFSGVSGSNYSVLQQSGLPARHVLLLGSVNQNAILSTNFSDPSSLRWTIQFPKRSRFGHFKMLNRIDPTDVSNFESQVFPVHSAALKNNKILLFAGSGNEKAIHNSGAFRIDTAAVFDPDSETLLAITPPVFDVFCSGHSIVDNGMVLVVGGTDRWDVEATGDPHHGHWYGSKKGVLYDPDTNAWAHLPDMPYGRWYPTTLMLADGRILVANGHTSVGDPTLSFSQVAEGSSRPGIRHENTDIDIFSLQNFEKVDANHYPVWDHEADDFCTSSDEADLTTPSGPYLRMHLLHDGTVFCCSHLLRVWNATNYAKDKTAGTWVRGYGVTMIWNPSSRKWSSINDGYGYSGSDKTSETITTTGSDTTSVLLPLLPKFNYQERVILVPETETDAYICTPFGADRRWLVSKKPVAMLRKFGVGLILADGSVALIGGENGGPTDYSPDDSSEAVHEVEVFNSVDTVQGSWTASAEQLINSRNYHGNAILMYDGRVLVSSSQIDGNADWLVDDYPGVTGNGGRDLSIEIYTPDYLWRGPRPVFSHTPDTVAVGGSFTIRLEEDWTWDLIDQSRVLLVKCASVTHGQALDQRCIGLLGTPRNGNQEIVLDIPDRGILTYGFYYLFISSIAGAPSLGHMIRILPPAQIISVLGGNPGLNY